MPRGGAGRYLRDRLTTVCLLRLSTMPEVRRVTGAYLTPLPVRCNLLLDAASELSVSTISFLFLAISCFVMIFIFYYMKWVLYLPLILGSFEGMTESSVFFPQFRLNELIGDHADYARGGLQRFMDFNPSFDLVFD